MRGPTSLRDLLADLRASRPGDGAEIEVIERLAGAPDPWDRRLPVHVTASAIIVHPPTQRILLRWHERQQSWLQVGGHADPGETDPFAIARREALEETGLSDLVPYPGPTARLVHVAVVPVPANDREPAHHHADIRFALATARPDDAIAESERAPLRWLPLHDARRLTSEENVRETLSRVGSLFPSI